MNVDATLGLAVGLAADAVAVCIALSLARAKTTTQPDTAGVAVGWLAVAFGVAQFGMALCGWLAGEAIASFAAAAMRWLAVAVLGLLGGRMLFFAEDPSADSRLAKPLTWKLLVLLAVLTSVDAAAAGLALDSLTDSAILACGVIGVVTLLLSAIGLSAGRRIGVRFGVLGERAGGVILLALAILIAVRG